MGSSYDEDLTDNAFFQTLKKDYSDVFYKVILEGCVICVPRSGSLPKFAITLDDLFGHIIIPNDEMPESHFQTLSGKELKICNRVVTINYDAGCQFSTNILFEETYYTEDLLKYKVLCIEHPLEPKSESHRDGLLDLRTLRDCMDFLQAESRSKNLTEGLDKVLEEYLANKEALENSSLQTLRDLTGALYGKCLQTALADHRLKEQAYTNAHMMRNVKLAVETYMHHGIYKQLFKLIRACVSHEDAKLNRTVRNSMDLQLRDLDVRAELHDLIPKARAELGKLDGYSTTLGKISCLRKMMAVIAKDPESGGLLAADDLLPIIIFLVIKTNITNWCAHLTYLKQFHFSSNISHCGDEDEFLVTTLEAAIEHVRTGVFLGPSCAGEDSIQMALFFQTQKEEVTTMNRLFREITKGNLEEVQRILEDDEPSLNFSDLKLCHPLCMCSKCHNLVAKNCRNSHPTVLSSDDAGLTALHIASMYGQPAIIDYLLSQNADLSATDLSGCSAMHHAALRGHQHALLLLAQAGTNVNAPDNCLNTPLHFCSINGHGACVKALIYHCEHEGLRLLVNAQNTNGDTPLHHACKFGYLSIVQALVENNADPSIVNRRKLSSFQVANNSKVSDILAQARPKFKCGINVKAANFDFLEEGPEMRLVAGEIPNSAEVVKRVEKMLRAISYGDVNLACFYLGLNPVHAAKHCHPLCSCVECGKTEVLAPSTSAEKLRVNICNSDGFTALHMAAQHGCLDLAQVLIQNNALLDVQTRSTLVTPLMIACKQQRIQIAQLLLQSNCRVNLQDNKGNTALHYACLQSSRRLVEAILVRGPKLSLKNRSGRTALQEAEAKLALGIVNMLKDASLQKQG